MAQKKEKWDIISPDGFSFNREGTYPSEEKAKEAAKQIVGERFKAQGYYSSMKFGRIPFDDILDYCEVKRIK